MALSRAARKNRFVRRLRVVFLVALVAALGALAALYWFGRAGRDEGLPRVVPDDELEAPADEDLVTRGEGFERTLSEGEQPLFSVRGDSYGVDREGVIYLDGVGLTFFREDGEPLELESTKARVKLEDKEATLWGGVTISGPDGLVLETERLSVFQQGRRLASDDEVRLLQRGSWRGRANQLRVRIPSRVFLLAGDVAVTSVPKAPVPFNLRSNRLYLERNRQLLRAEGRVRLARGGDRIRAQRIAAFFSEDEEVLRFLRARWGVKGRLVPGGGLSSALADQTGFDPLEDLAAESDEEEEEEEAAPSGSLDQQVIDFDTNSLALLFTEDGTSLQTVELEGGGGGGAELLARSPDGATQRVVAPRIVGQFEAGEPRQVEAYSDDSRTSELRLTSPAGQSRGVEARTMVSPRIVAQFAGGQPRRVEAFDGVELEEWGSAPSADRAAPAGPRGAAADSPPVTRRITGRGLVAEFDEAGEARVVTVTGQVEAVDGEVTGRGDSARFDLAEERGELTGTPAVLDSPERRFDAPKIFYTRGSGIVRGTGGVRAQLDDADSAVLSGTPLGASDGGSGSGTGSSAGADEPLRIDAVDGYLRDQPRSFLFQGNVRAWKGEDLLVADSLKGDDEPGILTATGSVRTVWNPPEDEDGRNPRSAAADTDEATGLAASDAPIEVTAEEMVFERDRRVLTYTGKARAEQEKRIIACERLELTMARDGEGGLEQLRCQGDTRIEDPVQGRTLTGGSALYRPDRRTVEVWADEGGKPVTLKDDTGRIVEGPRMIYEIDKDRVQVLGTETQGSPGSREAPAAPAPDGGEPGSGASPGGGGR